MAGTRDISIPAQWLTTFAVHPNRIFTTEGARRTRKVVSPHDGDGPRRRPVRQGPPIPLTDRAGRRRDRLAQQHGGTLLGPQLREGGEFASDAAAVFIKDGGDPDNFFFVTERPCSTPCVARVQRGLQDNRRVTDDGSLSVYWAGQCPLHQRRGPARTSRRTSRDDPGAARGPRGTRPGPPEMSERIGRPSGRIPPRPVVRPVQVRHRRRGPMRIIINGAGIAGPTLAYWLREGGHEVLLVEAVPGSATAATPSTSGGSATTSPRRWA